MKKLGKFIRKNSFDYELVKRSNKVAIYKLVDNTTIHQNIISFEVFIIKTNESREIFPNNQNFGTSLWTFYNDDIQALRKAIQKYNHLNKNI